MLDSPGLAIHSHRLGSTESVIAWDEFDKEFGEAAALNAQSKQGGGGKKKDPSTRSHIFLGWVSSHLNGQSVVGRLQKGRIHIIGLLSMGLLYRILPVSMACHT